MSDKGIQDALERAEGGFKIHGTIGGRFDCSKPNQANTPQGDDVETIALVESMLPKEAVEIAPGKNGAL